MGYSYIDKNYKEITSQIEQAKAASPNGEEPVFLVAIKSAELDEINYINEKFGITEMGENRVQQLLSRYEGLNEGINLHFIGSLQTNKVKYIADKVCMIHSLDRIELAREIDRQCKKIGKIMNVLVEINIGREENKGGILPEEAEAFCLSLSAFENIKLCGFMTMAPKCEKKDEYLKYFCETYEIVLDIWQKKLHNINIPVISMGMSESFVPAIESGSNMIRIGRGLFNKN